MYEHVRPALIVIWIARRVLALFETLATDVCSSMERVHQPFRAQNKLNKILVIVHDHLLVTRVREEIVYVWSFVDVFLRILLQEGVWKPIVTQETI